MTPGIARAPHWPQYLEVGIAVFAVDGGAVVRITRPSAGRAGGLAGRQRAVTQFGNCDLRAAFASTGVLREV